MKLHFLTGCKCMICDEETKTGVIFHKTRRQTHKLCEECLIGYLRPILKKTCNNLRKNIRINAEYVKCPGSYYCENRNQCKEKVELKNLKIEEKSPIYLDLFRIIFILSNDNIYMCQEEKCGQLIEVDSNYTDFKLSCSDCNTSWCRECLVSPFHDNISCIEYETYNQNTENGKYIRQMNNEGNLKFCLQCRTPTIKNNGCNKMYCSTCNVKWCWLCLDINIDYDHYNENNNKACANRLWE